MGLYLTEGSNPSLSATAFADGLPLVGRTGKGLFPYEEVCAVRYRVTRVAPWSAAKVGAVVGLVNGLVVALVIRAVSSLAAPFLQQFGGDVHLFGWAAVALVILLSGGFGGLAFAAGAVLYNLASWSGAFIEVDVTNQTEGSPDEIQPAARPKGLGDDAFSDRMFGLRGEPEA